VNLIPVTEVFQFLRLTGHRQMIVWSDLRGKHGSYSKGS